VAKIVIFSTIFFTYSQNFIVIRPFRGFGFSAQIIGKLTLIFQRTKRMSNFAGQYYLSLYNPSASKLNSTRREFPLEIDTKFLCDFISDRLYFRIRMTKPEVDSFNRNRRFKVLNVSDKYCTYVATSASYMRKLRCKIICPKESFDI